MKIKLTMIAALLLITGGISGCKKEGELDKPLKERMMGRWQVEKIETTSYNASGAVALTETKMYGTADYIDFKSNKEDEVEMNLGTGNRFIGNYVVTMFGTFNVALSNKLLTATVDNLTDSDFKFTATRDGSNPKVTETYYLHR